MISPIMDPNSGWCSVLREGRWRGIEGWNQHGLPSCVTYAQRRLLLQRHGARSALEPQPFLTRVVTVESDACY